MYLSLSPMDYPKSSSARFLHVLTLICQSHDLTCAHLTFWLQVAFLIKLESSFFIDFDEVSILIFCNQHLHHQISDCYQQKLDQIHFHSPYCHYPGLMHLHHGSVVFWGQVAHPLPSHPSNSTTPSFSPSLPFLNL